MIETPFREKTAEYYDRIYADGYSAASYRPVYEAVLDFLQRMRAASVLEVGCGTGELAAQVVAAGIPYRGFDISPVAVEQVRARGIETVRVGSAYAPDNYRPRDYNVIVALEVFEHIDDRGGRIELMAIDQPQNEWPSPLDAFAAALEHEKFITGKIDDLVEVAKEENDTAAEILLQWFVAEQVEEEASVQKVVDILKRVGDSGNGLLMIDRELGRRTASPSAGEAAEGTSR